MYKYAVFPLHGMCSIRKILMCFQGWTRKKCKSCDSFIHDNWNSFHFVDPENDWLLCQSSNFTDEEFWAHPMSHRSLNSVLYAESFQQCTGYCSWCSGKYRDDKDSGLALRKWDATNPQIYNTEQNPVGAVGDTQIAVRIQRWKREIVI